MKLETTKDFKSIVLNETPLIDVRAPIEFEKGAFPSAVNLPIMDDNERRDIGIKYKQEGSEEATKLGYNLVSGENRDNKVAAWAKFIDENPHAMLYCFRGGQRSKIAQEWMQNATGKPILRLDGGYKAFRNYLISEFEQEKYPYTPLRLGGYTGSGKTILLKEIKNSVDLEGIAHHRGSSFGRQIIPQPTQINFENRLAYDLIKLQNKGFEHIVFEDEGKNVGKCRIPNTFFDFIHSSDLIVLEVSFEKRTEITFDEYVINDQKNYIDYYGKDDGLRLWYEYITGSIDRIKKRLGGAMHQETIKMVDAGMNEQQKNGSLQKHKLWVASLLKNYYDPMYSYQMENNGAKMVFKGNEKAVLEYIRELKK